MVTDQDCTSMGCGHYEAALKHVGKIERVHLAREAGSCLSASSVGDRSVGDRENLKLKFEQNSNLK